MADFGQFRGFGDKLFQGQLPTQLGTIGSVSVFNPDSISFFDRVTTAGGTLSTLEKSAVDTLVNDLQSYGLWSKMKAIYPMVGASAAACAQNLKSSSFTGTFNGGITYASTGITSNGSNGYMNTNLNPNTSLSLNSTHISFYSRTNNLDDTDLGAYSSANVGLQLLIRSSAFNAFAARVNSGSAITQSLSDGRVFAIANRKSSTQVGIVINGTNTNYTNNSGSLPNLNVFLLALNYLGNPTDYSIKECAFASIGDGLTDTEASNFYTAVQAFQTTLSRNV
jgi:hypothetical protein